MTVVTELNDAWTSWLASSLYNTWRTANPNENTKLLAYRAGTQGRPALVTPFGKALVCETAAWILSGGSGGPPPPPPGPGPSGYYWYQTWVGGSVPADWLTEERNSDTTYAFVPDPLGTQAATLRLRCAYRPSQANDYTSAALQLVSLFRGAGQAFSGYQQVAQESWYRDVFMVPAGNVLSSGETNFIREWHTDNDTQGQGGNSSSLYLPCNFPLVQSGVNPTVCTRFASGTPSSPDYTYWPSSNGSGAFANRNGPALILNHWYESLHHVIWSKNPAVGKMEWWLDGQLMVSKQMATLYTNNSLPNGQSYNTDGLYMYRYNVSGGTSTIYRAVEVAGPTRASVGA